MTSLLEILLITRNILDVLEVLHVQIWGKGQFNWKGHIKNTMEQIFEML